MRMLLQVLLPQLIKDKKPNFYFSKYSNTKLGTKSAKERPADLPKTTTTKDTEKPVITYIQELKTLYNVGAKVILNFKVSDNKKLKQINLKAVNTTTDSVYLNKVFNTTLNKIEIKDSIYTNLTTTMANFTIFIEAFDSTGNKAMLDKAFHVMD